VVLTVLALGGVAYEIGTGLGSPKTPPSTAQLVAMVQPSVVTVRVKMFRAGTAEATGFIYGKPGHVLTTARVVTRPIAIDVIDVRGQTWSAALIGIDRARDIAELKVNFDSLIGKPIRPAARLPEVGRGVLVVGNPFVSPDSFRDGELGSADVMRGVVGGVGQDLSAGPVTFHNLIQTDAVVNRWNFGSPMINGAGELLGMVILGETGQAFGIPVRDLDSVAVDWTSKDDYILLAPPLVEGPASALMLPLPPGFQQIKSEPWTSTGYAVGYKKPADYDYGSTSIDIYIDVLATEGAGQRGYQSRVDWLRTYGYAMLGSSSDLGDEMTWWSKNGVGYGVLWRDRNAWVLLYLTSGSPPRPEVSLATTLNLASQQASLLAVGLANYE
jgi:hypothetical protein